MPNHHTVARANNNSKEQREEWKQKIQAGQILNRLLDGGAGEVELTSSQIKCYEVVLDRIVPRLSAVEQTEVNELDTLTREDILLRIQLLLRADPSLLTELVALQARESADSTPTAAPAAKLVAK